MNLIDAQKPHVLALTEFGASDAISDSELGIDDYTLYRSMEGREGERHCI